MMPNSAEVFFTAWQSDTVGLTVESFPESEASYSATVRAAWSKISRAALACHVGPLSCADELGVNHKLRSS